MAKGRRASERTRGGKGVSEDGRCTMVIILLQVDRMLWRLTVHFVPVLQSTCDDENQGQAAAKEQHASPLVRVFSENDLLEHLVKFLTIQEVGT